MKYLILLLVLVSCGSRKTHEQAKQGTVDMLMPDTSISFLMNDSIPLTTGDIAIGWGESRVSYLMVIGAYGNQAYMREDSSIKIEGDTMKLIKQMFIFLLNNNKKQNP